MPPGSSSSAARLAGHQVQRGALLRSSFGQREGAGIEIESGKRPAAIRDLPAVAPVQTAGNHQVQDQPEVVVESNGDAFADSPQPGHLAAKRRFERGIGGAEQKRSADQDVVERFPANALIERFDIDDDIRQLWHFDSF